jgi:hypothetical protein
MVVPLTFGIFKLFFPSQSIRGRLLGMRTRKLANHNHSPRKTNWYLGKQIDLQWKTSWLPRKICVCRKTDLSEQVGSLNPWHIFCMQSPRYRNFFFGQHKSWNIYCFCGAKRNFFSPEFSIRLLLTKSLNHNFFFFSQNQNIFSATHC